MNPNSPEAKNARILAHFRAVTGVEGAVTLNPIHNTPNVWYGQPTPARCKVVFAVGADTITCIDGKWWAHGCPTRQNNVDPKLQIGVGGALTQAAVWGWIK
jgi:hypothetical protein